MDNNFPSSSEEKGRPEHKHSRLERLIGPGARKTAYNPAYSRFIRRMKLLLPVAALSIAAAVFTWSYVQDQNIEPVSMKPDTVQAAGKNELLNPRFESRDEKNQPYTLTAERAVQSKNDENLVFLVKPLGDMLLNTGNWIAAQAEQGAFRQDNQRLLLSGDVRLFHDSGYSLEMERLDVDMKNRTAWSEVDIHGRGPEGTLEAKGLQANANANTVLFNGLHGLF